MLNKSGITSQSYTNPKQILANVELQGSVGCIVPQSLVTSADANGKKIAKAGTPININLENTSAAVKAPAAAAGSEPAVPMNAVLLHDVDVTAGNANGTALYFGVVNLNRVETAVATAIATAKGYGTPSPLLVFVKL